MAKDTISILDGRTSILEPSPEGLACDPRLPEGIERLELRGVPGRWGRTDAVADLLEATR